MTRAKIMMTLLIGFLTASCQSSDSATATERFVGEAEGFSLEMPVEWSPHRERGSVMFTAAAQPKRSIVVRSVPRAKGTPDAALLQATDVVMNGLPDVEIASKRPTTVPMSGTVYELTFVPPGATGSYRRTHVVLLGEQHVFHLIETAPSETTSGSAIVTKLIDSFREEV